MSDRFTFHADRLEALTGVGWGGGEISGWLDDPGFRFDDDDWYPADLLLQAATDTGVIECPPGATLWLDCGDSGDGPVYEVRVTITPPPGGGNGALRLSGDADEYPPNGKEGRAAIIGWLEEAVWTANGILDLLEFWAEEHVGGGWRGLR